MTHTRVRDVLFLVAGAGVGVAATLLVSGIPTRSTPSPSPPAKRASETASAGAAAPSAALKRMPAKSNILEVAIEVNRILEPDIDEKALRRALTHIVAGAGAALRGVDSPEETVAVLNRVLLEDREVTYLSNVYWRDASLAAALLRKKGNCLATTTLYVLVARELALPIYAVAAPQHVLARFDGLEPINIETTKGGKRVADSAMRFNLDFGDEETRDYGYGHSLTDDEFATILLLCGAGHLDAAGRTEDALVLADRAAALWPGSVRVILTRASLLYQMSDRREEALAVYAGLVDAQPGRSRTARAAALTAVAGHEHVLGRQEDALRRLRRAFAIAPRTSQDNILTRMSTCYRSVRRFPEAALAQELALLLAPDPAALTGLAVMYKNAGHLGAAVRALKGSLEANPEDWNTRLILAGYLIRAGRTDEGWQMFATVKEPRVDKMVYETNLAWFYGSIGKKDEFLAHLEKALTLSRTPFVLNYVATEVDFDRYREDPDLKALIEKHRSRLLHGETDGTADRQPE